MGTYGRDTDDRRYDQTTVGLLIAIGLLLVSVGALVAWAATL